MKKGFEISLHTIVDLVLAAMALIVVTTIIAATLAAIYSEKGAAQRSGFTNIVNNIEENEKAGVTSEYKHALGYLKEEFIIIGFNKRGRVVEGDCYHPQLADYVYSIWDLRFGTDKYKVHVTADRPDKCPQGNSCLCLCKFKKDDDIRIDCIEGQCYRFEESLDINFGGVGSCNVPVMYPNEGSSYQYCMKWSGENILFEPHSCMESVDPTFT